MIDPADTVTKLLPVTTPMRLVVDGPDKVIHAEIGQDLLGDWFVTQSWLGKPGGKTEGRAGRKLTLVASHEEGLSLLDKVVKRNGR